MPTLLAVLAPAAEGAVAPSGAIGLIWLTILLPFLGFVANGVLAFRNPGAKGAVSVIGPATVLAAFGVTLAAFAQAMLCRTPPLSAPQTANTRSMRSLMRPTVGTIALSRSV